jgi:hypothetical protein
MYFFFYCLEHYLGYSYVDLNLHYYSLYYYYCCRLRDCDFYRTLHWKLWKLWQYSTSCDDYEMNDCFLIEILRFCVFDVIAIRTLAIPHNCCQRRISINHQNWKFITNVIKVTFVRMWCSLIYFFVLLNFFIDIVL